MRIISLTSIPSRFPYLGQSLEALVRQDVDQVRLYIPHYYARFPDWDGELPSVPLGVTVVRVERDYGPATKILPVCREFRGQDAQILFCDDDGIVPSGWARRLFDVQARRPSEAVAVYVRPVKGYVPNDVRAPGRRARQLPIRFDVPYRVSRLAARIFGTQPLARRPFVISGYGEIFFGVGGVVVRPEFFDDAAFEIPDVARLVDDIWLSANLARRGIRIYCPAFVSLPRATEASPRDALLETDYQGRSRQDLNRAASRHCQEMFGIWQ